MGGGLINFLPLKRGGGGGGGLIEDLRYLIDFFFAWLITSVNVV